MKFRINPVYLKEVKISVRTVKMAMIILGYNVVLALIGLLSFYFTFDYAYSSSARFSGILEIYLFLAMIEFGLVLFVVPAFTSSAISGEREKQTLEILLTTKLSPLQIIVGKLMSSISSTLLLVFSSLPTLSIVFLVGGVRLIDLIKLMIFCVITAIFVGSIGIFFSTCFKRTIPSTVFTYASILLLVLGTLAIIGAAYLFVVRDYDQQFYVNGLGQTYNPPGVGNLVLLLLLNPAASLLSLLGSQFGSPHYFMSLISSYGKTNAVILHHWYGISVSLQLFLAIFLLYLSARKLNPLRGKK